MLLIPIGRDDAEIRRHAWVSYVILAMNVLVFVVSSAAMRPSALIEIQRQWETAFEYYAERPYLKAPSELATLIPEDADARIVAQRNLVQKPSARKVAAEQAELAAKVSTAIAARDRLPFLRFGYIPAQGRVHTMFTSMFLHAGLLHLLGNLLFFYLSGPFIEDVYGRPLFAALYLSGGVIAALTFAARDPEGATPLVGASGAIAAVMGAYLARFHTSKIELLFVPFLFRPTLNFRFFVPAFVVLPAWFAQQLLEMRYEMGGGGVAFSAHVGGFVYGFLFAVIVAVLRFEQTFVEPKVVKETTWKMDDRFEQALVARRTGDDDSAKVALRALLRDEPQNGDALRMLLDIAREEENWAEIDPLATRLLQIHLTADDQDAARELVNEVTHDKHAKLPKLFARAAAWEERNGDRDRALHFYRRAYESDPNAASTVPTLVKASALLRASGDLTRSRQLLERARAHPACTAEWSRTIEERLTS